MNRDYFSFGKLVANVDVRFCIKALYALKLMCTAYSSIKNDDHVNTNKCFGCYVINILLYSLWLHVRDKLPIFFVIFIFAISKELLKIVIAICTRT